MDSWWLGPPFPGSAANGIRTGVSSPALRISARPRPVLPELRPAQEARGHRHGCPHTHGSQPALADTHARTDSGAHAHRDPVFPAGGDHPHTRHRCRTVPNTDDTAANPNSIPDCGSHPTSRRDCTHTHPNAAHTNPFSCTDTPTHPGPYPATRSRHRANAHPSSPHTDADDTTTDPHTSANVRPAPGRHRTHPHRNPSPLEAHAYNHPATNPTAHHFSHRHSDTHANADGHLAACGRDLGPAGGDASSHANTHSGCRFPTSDPRSGWPGRRRHSPAGSRAFALCHTVS